MMLNKLEKKYFDKNKYLWCRNSLNRINIFLF